ILNANPDPLHHVAVVPVPLPVKLPRHPDGPGADREDTAVVPAVAARTPAVQQDDVQTPGNVVPVWDQIHEPLDVPLEQEVAVPFPGPFAGDGWDKLRCVVTVRSPLPVILLADAAVANPRRGFAVKAVHDTSPASCDTPRGHAVRIAPPWCFQLDCRH